MRDKQSQAIVDKAAKAEQRRSRVKPRKPEPDGPPAKSPTRFGVWWHMHDGINMFPWIFAFITTILLVILGSRTEQRTVLYLALVGAGVILIRFAIFVVGLIRGYGPFKAFPADLKIPLEGWDRMLDERIVGDPSQFQDEAVLTVTPAAGADTVLFEAVLELALRDLNNHFYGSSFVGKLGDPRTRWTRQGLRVSGALNVCVLGALYRLIRKLDSAHRRAGGIDRIHVSKGGGISKYESDVSGGE